MASSNPSIPHTVQVDLLAAPPAAAVRAGSDPAVTAAFVAFHRQHTPSLFARDGRENVPSVASWVCLGLAAVSFGGGLFLASVSFNNNSDAPGTVAARAPEMIYLPPAESAERALPVSDTAPRAASLMAKVDPQPSLAQTTLRDVPPAESALTGFDKWSIASASDPGSPDATANFTVAMRHSAAGYSLANASSDAVESAYAGIELPTVPEGDAAPFVCGGLALLIGLTHLRKRRKTIRRAT
ncbi:MAG: hypothetical protein H0W20_01555 [Chthoniobacterales bacterium]|nr:hypothetical protein [Chthoniobacterales bacterium]